MKALFIILVIALSSLSFGQEAKTFSFDLGYGINGYNMNSINDFYIDSFAATPKNDYLREYVKNGQSFRLGVNYIPISWIDVGFYGGYQFSSLTRSEEHTSELQSRPHLVCRLLLEKKNKK